MFGGYWELLKLKNKINDMLNTASSTRQETVTRNTQNMQSAGIAQSTGLNPEVENPQSDSPRIARHNPHDSKSEQSLDARSIASETSESPNSELAELRRLITEQKKQIQELQNQVDQDKLEKEKAKQKNDELKKKNRDLKQDKEKLKEELQNQYLARAPKSQEEYRREAYERWLKENPTLEGTDKANMKWRQLKLVTFGPSPILDRKNASKEMQESLDVLEVRFRIELEDLLENFIELASQYNKYQKYQGKNSEFAALDSYKENDSFKHSFIARMAQEMPQWIIGYQDKYIYSYAKPYVPVKVEFNQEILSFVETNLEQFRRWTVMIMKSLKEVGAFSSFFDQNNFSKKATKQGFEIVKIIFKYIESEMPQLKEENERQLQKGQVEDFLHNSMFLNSS